jgi:hypothetical protein
VRQRQAGPQQPMSDHLHPGELAPRDGEYLEHNVFGAPGRQRIMVRAGERLLPLPIGFTWVLVEGEGCPQGESVGRD